jgi:hypothetical protein
MELKLNPKIICKTMERKPKNIQKYAAKAVASSKG